MVNLYDPTLAGQIYVRGQLIAMVSSEFGTPCIYKDFGQEIDGAHFLTGSLAF